MFSKLKNFSEDVAKSLNDMSMPPDQQPNQPAQRPDPLLQLQRNSKILQAETPDTSQLVQPTEESENPTRQTSPAIASEGTTAAAPSYSSADANENLPPAVKSKLKKFAKYEEKYPLLLDAYKIEKKKTELIKVFELVLKENTPISSLADAKILVEYLNGINEKNKIQSTEIRRLTKENSMLSFKVAKSEEQGQSSDKTLQNLENLQKENELLKGNIKKLQEEKLDLEESKSKSNEQDDSNKIIIAEQNSETESLEKQELESTTIPSKMDDATVKELKQDLEKKSKECDEISSKLSTARKELEDKTEEIEDLRDSVKSIGNDLMAAKDKIKELRVQQQQPQQIAEEESTKSSSERNGGEKTAISSSSSEVLEKLAKEVSTWKEKHSAKVKEVEELNAKITNLEEDVHLRNVESKQAEGKLRKEVQSIKKVKDELEAKLKECENELDDHKREKINLETRIEELSSFKSNETSLKLQISSLQASLKHKDEIISELKTKMDTLGRDASELTRKVENLTKTNDQMQANCMGLLKRKNELLTKQELHMDNEKSLNAQITKLQQEKQSIRNELESTKSKLEALVSEKSTAKNDILLFKKDYDEIAMRSKEYNLRIENLEDDISEARNLLSERNREASNMRRLLVDAQDMLKQKDLDHKQEISRLGEEKLELEKTTNGLIKKRQKEVDELQKSLKQSESQVQRLGDQVASLSTQLVEAGADDHDNNNPNNNNHNNNNGAAGGDLQQQIDTLRTALSTATDKARDYEKTNASLKKLNENNIAKFERLSKNYKLLTQQYRYVKQNEKQETHKQQQQQLEERSRNSSIASHDSDADVSFQEQQSRETNIAYLKNVLLGYFEHKEQREQLLPVLKTIFQFNKEDETKFLLAIK
ncbi:uncharacterized protein LODBEIA_P08450 [Lodderomyces beijingensis]|uniref:GRIP domain-containing protein n=1 Tax=Lodderomyces beijingensis TaxID=1775926 RepID=A0ABP0ZHN7_9ASCO